MTPSRSSFSLTAALKLLLFFDKKVPRAGGCAGSRYPFLTLYERDNETNLDFARARYFSNIQGRFVSVDPAMGSAKPEQPQTWNRYTYTVNNPLRFVDPSGMDWGMKRTDKVVEYVWFLGEVGEGYEKVTEFYVEGYIDGKNVSLTLNPDGPRPWWKQLLLNGDVGLSLLADNSDYVVKGYAIGETWAQWEERNRTGAIDMMPNQAFSVALFFAGGGLGRLNRGYTPSVNTPYGPAFQSTSAEALTAREAVENGATLFRGGVLGRSHGPEGQFWALENPLNPGYPQRYGIPSANSQFNFH